MGEEEERGETTTTTTATTPANNRRRRTADEGGATLLRALKEVAAAEEARRQALVVSPCTAVWKKPAKASHWLRHSRFLFPSGRPEWALLNCLVHISRTVRDAGRPGTPATAA